MNAQPNHFPCLRVWLAGACLVLVSLAIPAHAHDCGPESLKANVGDILTWQITSDVDFEGQPSDYEVLFYDPNIVAVTPSQPFSIFADGQWYLDARSTGQTAIVFYWDYPPHLATGYCSVVLTVLPPGTTKMSAANEPESATDGDPVNLYTGELVLHQKSDLNLGGPMPLQFTRYYASGLARDALVHSPLGKNWSCNFDWHAIRVSNQVDVISDEGRRIRFQQNGNSWQFRGNPAAPYQLISSGGNLVLGDPRENRLYTFDTNGFLISIADGKGNAHTLTYNGTILLSVSDGLGRTLMFTNNGFHQLTAVSDGQRVVGFGYDANTLLTSVTDALGRFTQYEYDPSNAVAGLMTSQILPLGNVHYTQVFNTNGQVIQQITVGQGTNSFAYAGNTTVITNAFGQTRTFVHNRLGQLISFTDEGGQTSTLAAATNAQSTVVSDRLGHPMGIAYHPPSGKVSAITNAQGRVTTFSYTPRVTSGNTFYDLSQITYYDGTQELFTQDAVGNTLGHTDRAGQTWAATYNNHGQTLSILNPQGGIAKYTYTADGSVATTADSDTGPVNYGYDSLRRLTNLAYSDGSSWQAGFDADDRALFLTDQRGNTYRMFYDANGNLIDVVDPLGNTNVFLYDSQDRMVTTMDRLGRSSSLAFDAMDHVIFGTNRNGFVTGFSYDNRQRLVGITDPGGGTWHIGYDNEAAPTSFTNPLNQSLYQLLDIMRYPIAFTNALGNVFNLARDPMELISQTADALNRTNSYTYDTRGLLTSATRTGMGITDYQRNSLGQVTLLTDPNGRHWTFTHTSMGRLSATSDPLNHITTYSYNSRGWPQLVRYPDGSSRTNSYDGVGNLLRQQFSDGTDLQFSYDALNRLTNANSLALAYDAEGRITNTVSAGVIFGAACDPEGRVTNLTYNAGLFSVAYTYDSRDRLIRVRDSLTGTQLDFSYDDADRLIGLKRANGVNGVYTYDAAGRLTRIQEGSIVDLQYTLDAVGQVIQVSFGAPLDPGGLLLLAPTNLTYDAAHEISLAGYAYDAQGRLVTTPGHTFVYDAASRLTTLDTVAFTYNGLGELLSRTKGASDIRYHYNYAVATAPIVAEQNAANGQFLRYYIWAPTGELLYEIDAANGNAVYYFHFDRVGSTLALTAANGVVSDAYAYSPYGELVGRQGSNPQPFTFVGRAGVRSEPGSNLYQMRARFYDATTARFLTRDPLWPRLARPESLNPYEYAAQNPLKYIDPAGTEEIDMYFIDQDIGIGWRALHGNQDTFTDLGDIIKQIKSKLGPNDCLHQLTIVAHGAEGVNGFVAFGTEDYVTMGSHEQPFYSSPEAQQKLQELRKLFCKDGSIVLRICNAGKGVAGDIVLQALANDTGVPVTGPEDKIKCIRFGGCTVPWKTKSPNNGVTPTPPNTPKPNNGADVSPVTESSRTTR